MCWIRRNWSARTRGRGSAAGVRFAFDAETLQMAANLIERTLEELEPLAREG
jgi:hypothetical protein